MRDFSPTLRNETAMRRRKLLIMPSHRSFLAANSWRRRTGHPRSHDGGAQVPGLRAGCFSRHTTSLQHNETRRPCDAASRPPCRATAPASRRTHGGRRTGHSRSQDGGAQVPGLRHGRFSSRRTQSPMQRNETQMRFRRLPNLAGGRPPADVGLSPSLLMRRSLRLNETRRR